MNTSRRHILKSFIGALFAPLANFVPKPTVSKTPAYMIPMIRRTFPELITYDLNGVQPMAGPVGLAFALQHHYDKSTSKQLTSAQSE